MKRALRRIGLGLVALISLPLLVLAAYALYVVAGVWAGAGAMTGTLSGLGVRAPVRIARDARGIPHVRAGNERDLFFAEGYLQGSERLFQLDVYRRLVAGRLAEVFGSAALESDVEARVVDVAGIIRDQERSLDPRERDDVQAFADGVNAAMRTRPLPPEFRVLAYQPEPWTREDSLRASFATVLTLTDSWNDVLVRADVADALGSSALDAFFPITDPRYDSPTTTRVPAPVAKLPPLKIAYPAAAETRYGWRPEELPDRAGLGSNNVVAGAALTSTHRALLANDPHLDLHMPGIWYLADLAAPGLHAAGAMLPGSPGIILGHSAHVAWGATNGTVATVEIYREQFRTPNSDAYRSGTNWERALHRHETFNVRFGAAVTRDYLRTRHGFVFASRGATRYAAAWTADLDRRSPYGTFAGLDRASSVSNALRALAAYPGPPQNFVLADDRGNAAYVLAGAIPIDPLWALRAHDGPTTGAPIRKDVPFAALPHVAPARSALAFSANDRVYGAGYPYRLTAFFEPPYRAARIAQHLGKPPFSVGNFSAIQADVLSLPERDLAAATVAALKRKGLADGPELRAAAAALAAFDGRYNGDSRGALYAWQLRRSAVARIVRLHLAPDLANRYLSGHAGMAVVVVLRMLRERPAGWVPGDDYDAFLVAALRDALGTLHDAGRLGLPWSEAGRAVARHPLAAFGWHGWDGVPFPGLGSGYSPHVQGSILTQSLRAVWDVGNWEAGGIVIPQGESGEPGSAHYRDLAHTWIAGPLVPLPFDDAAVAAATTEVLELRP